MSSCLLIDVRNFIGNQKFDLGFKRPYIGKVELLRESSSLAEFYNHVNKTEDKITFVYYINMANLAEYGISIKKVKEYLVATKHKESIEKNEKLLKPIDYRIKLVERITIKNEGMLFPLNLISSWFQISAWRLIMLYKKFRLFVNPNEEEKSVSVVKFCQKHQLLDKNVKVEYAKNKVVYKNRDDLTFKSVLKTIVGDKPSWFTIVKVLLFVWVIILQSLDHPKGHFFDYSITTLFIFSIKTIAFVSEEKWLRFLFFIPSPFILHAITTRNAHSTIAMTFMLFPKLDVVALLALIIFVRFIEFINYVIWILPRRFLIK